MIVVLSPEEIDMLFSCQHNRPVLLVLAEAEPDDIKALLVLSIHGYIKFESETRYRITELGYNYIKLINDIRTLGLKNIVAFCGNIDSYFISKKLLMENDLL